MKSGLKKFAILFAWVLGIAVLLSLILFLNSTGNKFLPVLADVLFGMIRIAIPIAAIWYVLYAPVIFLVRKLWKQRSEKKQFANPQTAKVFSRFIANTGAMFGVVTLFYACVLFVIAHLIAPDPTPNAGFQINEIAFKPPGFHITVLNVPLEIEQPQTSFFKWLTDGKNLPYRQVPIENHWLQGDSLLVERYLGDGVAGDTLQFAVQKIIPGYRAAEAVDQMERYAISHRYFLFGTDDLGRDYLSRVLLGVRVSLAVGCIAVFIALVIGIPVGAAAGFYKKEPPKVRIFKRRYVFPVDSLLMWTMSVIWAIPALLLVFPIVFAFGQQFYTIFIAVGLTMWVDIARIVRGQVMQVREMEYITATKNFGFSNFRTVFLHILPNIIGPVIVITAANFAYAILTEAGLSFLGIGVQPPAPSWGLMILKYKDNLITDPYLALIPGTAITVLVLAFFMIGNGLRDALDIKSQVGNN